MDEKDKSRKLRKTQKAPELINYIKIYTNIDEELWERKEESATGSRRHLGRVHRRDHQCVANSDAGHEAANHEKGVVGGQAHEQSAEEEYNSGQDYGESTAYPIGGGAGDGGADERVEAEDAHDHLFLYVGYV